VITAAKILGKVGDVTRFPSSGHFTSYTGTAPLDASARQRTPHRLNTGGNRQLNATLPTIAVCQGLRSWPRPHLPPAQTR